MEPPGKQKNAIVWRHHSSFTNNNNVHYNSNFYFHFMKSRFLDGHAHAFVLTMMQIVRTDLYRKQT